MINMYTTAQGGRWHDRPLCCRYVVAHFGALDVRVQEDAIALDLTAHWALGALVDGQLDVFGLWLEPGSDAMPWQQVFDDLELRGVERIRFASAAESTKMYATYRGTTVLPSLGRILRPSLAPVTPRDRVPAAAAMRALRAAATVQAARNTLDGLSASPWGGKHLAAIESLRAALPRLAPFYTLAPRLRRIILSAEDAAEQVQSSLTRAVARHGCFADHEAAVSFLAKALERAERSLDDGLAGRPTSPAHRASGPENCVRAGAFGL